MVVVWYFVCSYCMALGETFKAKTWERICRRQLLSDKRSRISKLFVYTPRIAPIGGMIIEVEYTLQWQLRLVCK